MPLILSSAIWIGVIGFASGRIVNAMVDKTLIPVKGQSSRMVDKVKLDRESK